MKKITFSLFMLANVLGFSQDNIVKIKNHLLNNLSKSKITSTDISDLVITNDFTTADGDVFIYHVKQRINGIEVFTSDSNFAIKNGEVISGDGRNFEKNISQIANGSKPSVSITEAFSKAILGLSEKSVLGVSILEKGQNNKYKLSNGSLIDDPVNAQLVYYKVGNSLKLSWTYEFYSQDYSKLWFVIVDAVNGQLLLKENHTLSCNFHNKDHLNHNHNSDMSKINDNAFSNSFIKENKSLALTPGTTNYKVIPWNYESPNHYKLAFPASTDGRTTVTNPEVTTFPAASPASPNGWHNASTTIGAATTTYAYTRGNNVFAYTDLGNTNPTTPTTYASASSGTYPSLTFDFPYGGTGASPSTYRNAAVANLFYQNNMMHDIWYQYGFNEANKNFQASNFGRGGTQGDFVKAEAQDASTAATPSYNNANFSTPADGSSPRMQMYLWNLRKQSDLHINTGTLAGTNYKVNDNAFSPGHVFLPVPPASPLTADLMLVDDGTPDSSDACADATTGAVLAAGSMSGKIAVIRRGTCSFVLKVKAVQDAGAIAAIVVNNTTGGISMAGADSSITIPAVSMTQTEGEALITSMQSGTVSVNLSSPEQFLYSDGDFDNGIISHEFGHGISTRLSGNCLGGSEQMGEGWSDWFWLIMQVKPTDIAGSTPTLADGAGVGARGIGTFAENQPTTDIGIRQYKYSTNMTENPHTYAATNSMWYTDSTSGTDKVDVHSVGSVWAVILWDLAWNYMNKYGYNSDILNTNGLNKGNNRIMKLVLDAIKIDGCDPTFVTGRDALIQADVAATGGQNVCMIFDTFARRGVGQGASSGANSGSVADIQDQVESFTTLTPGATPATGSACTLAANNFDINNTIAIYPNPNNGQFNIQISQFEGTADLEIVDINGRVVYARNDVDFSSEKTINLSQVQSGIYIVKVKSDNSSLVKKLIIE